MADEIETMAEWNAVIARCCPCMVQPVSPEPVSNIQTISITVCGFALPEFEKMTAAQREARYETLSISYVYDSVNIYRETEFSVGVKINSRTTSNQDLRTNYKRARQADGDCATDKTTSSIETTYIQNNSNTYPEGSSYTDNSGIYTIKTSASGKDGQPAVGTITITDVGTDEYGEPYSLRETDPYTYFGLSESAYINEAEFQSGGTYVYRQSTSTGGTEGGTTNTTTTNLVVTRKYDKLIKVVELLAKKKFPEDAGSSPVLYSEYLAFSGKRSRFQFQIPSEHLGTTFKISWDYLEEPEGWNATIPDPAHTGPGTPPQIPKPGRPKRTLKTGGTWTWKGPGKQNDPNGDSWKSPWFEIPVPSFKGRVKRVNLRFEGTPNNPWGSLPQIMGEGYDPADP